MSIQHDREWTFVTTAMGLRVKWNEEDALFVTLDRAEHSGQASGLCGVYNGYAAGLPFTVVILQVRAPFLCFLTNIVGVLLGLWAIFYGFY